MTKSYRSGTKEIINERIPEESETKLKQENSETEDGNEALSCFIHFKEDEIEDVITNELQGLMNLNDIEKEMEIEVPLVKHTSNNVKNVLGRKNKK